MKNNNMYVGMDTDKNSIDVAIGEEGRNKEVRHYGRIENNLSSIDKLVGKLESLGHTLHFVYEAGPCGYTIYRHLRAKGIDCAVVAPSQIPKRSGDRVKTNRRDAINLARLHRAGELHRVYVPLPEDEAMRDLSRAREDAKRAEIGQEGRSAKNHGERGRHGQFRRRAGSGGIVSSFRFQVTAIAYIEFAVMTRVCADLRTG